MTGMLHLKNITATSTAFSIISKHGEQSEARGAAKTGAFLHVIIFNLQSEISEKNHSGWKLTVMKFMVITPTDLLICGMQSKITMFL